MPRGDQSGPQGFGPMTGRKMGFCSGANQPGYNRLGGGWGMRGGRGGGQYANGRQFFGMRGGFGPYAGFGPAASLEDEPQENAQTLKNQAAMLTSELAKLNERINKLDDGKDQD
ncbi:DUF5320 domain-containing protein [bacterium]|nr:DUF5320 domain-containing protein [bacterium]